MAMAKFVMCVLPSRRRHPRSRCILTGTSPAVDLVRRAAGLAANTSPRSTNVEAYLGVEDTAETRGKVPIHLSGSGGHSLQPKGNTC